MTVADLIATCQSLIAEGVPPTTPVIIDGYEWGSHDLPADGVRLTEHARDVHDSPGRINGPHEMRGKYSEPFPVWVLCVAITRTAPSISGD